MFVEKIYCINDITKCNKLPVFPLFAVYMPLAEAAVHLTLLQRSWKCSNNLREPPLLIRRCRVFSPERSMHIQHCFHAIHVRISYRVTYRKH